MAKDKRRKKVSLDFWNGKADVTNVFKTLFANIRFASVDKEIKSIVIVGSGVNEGKSMVSLNLANAIASAGHKVLIVEGDMRKNSLGDILDIHPQYGVFSILSGVCTPKEACTETKIENLYLLDSENNIPSPPDLLSASRFAALVDNLQDKYDYVIFDTPPLASFVDGAIIANLVDATIIVVRQGKAKRSSVNEIINQLRTANANILGTVLTFSTEASEKDYYYAYYNKDHKRVNKEDFKPREEVSDEIAQNNLNSWLNEETEGRAEKRRDAMTPPGQHEIKRQRKSSYGEIDTNSVKPKHSSSSSNTVDFEYLYDTENSKDSALSFNEDDTFNVDTF